MATGRVGKEFVKGWGKHYKKDQQTIMKRGGRGACFNCTWKNSTEKKGC